MEPVEPVRKGARAEGVGRLGRAGRVLLFLGAALVILAFRFPLGSLTMRSVQHPDGLKLFVYLDRLAGDVLSINLLGREVGIRWLHWGVFPEMRLLPYATGALALWLVALALVGRRKWVRVTAVVLGVGLAVGGGDVALRTYQISHHLDPRAPIRMEPFAIALLGTSYFANYQVQSRVGLAAALIGGAAAAVALAAWLQTSTPGTGVTRRGRRAR